MLDIIKYIFGYIDYLYISNFAKNLLGLFLIYLIVIFIVIITANIKAQSKDNINKLFKMLIVATIIEIFYLLLLYLKINIYIFESILDKIVLFLFIIIPYIYSVYIYSLYYFVIIKPTNKMHHNIKLSDKFHNENIFKIKIIIISLSIVIASCTLGLGIINGIILIIDQIIIPLLDMKINFQKLEF